MSIVAFQGVAGAYSETAIYQFVGPDSQTLPCPSLEGIFEAVEKGRAELGMLPVENALSGSLTQDYEMLMDGVILIIDADKTNRAVVSRAAQILNRGGERMLGIVFNQKRFYTPRWLSISE